MCLNTVHQGQSFCSFQVNGAIRKQLTPVSREEYHGGMEPLAARIRPQTITEVVGQEHLVGVGKPLRVAVEKKHLFSFILWGPPGTGKTTIARIYARALDAELFELSAVSAGKGRYSQTVGPYFVRKLADYEGQTGKSAYSRAPESFVPRRNPSF